MVRIDGVLCGFFCFFLLLFFFLFCGFLCGVFLCFFLVCFCVGFVCVCVWFFFGICLLCAGVQHILCRVFVLFCLSSSYILCYLMLQFSLDCQFLINISVYLTFIYGTRSKLIWLYIDSPSVARGLRYFSTQRELNEWLNFLI